MNVSDFFIIASNLFNLNDQDDWDNSGAQILLNENLKNILVALDVTSDVIDEAKNKNCNVIITHHPLFFKDIKNIDYQVANSKLAIEAIRNDISIFSFHTCADKKYLSVCAKSILDKQVDIVHDDFTYALIDTWNMSVFEIVNEIGNNIDETIRFAGDGNIVPNKVAFLNGSACSLFSQKTKKIQFKCVITGDVTYHYAVEFANANCVLIDAGHFSTEIVIKKIMCEDLKEICKKNNLKNVNIYCATNERSPFNVKK